jgi:uncharacterized protein
MSANRISEDAIETPQYLITYEQELKAWRECSEVPMPMPKVPKIAPDELIMMPMRDGVKLYTELFFPRETPGSYPTILIRTPYPDSTFPFSAKPIELFRQAGYAVAVQSCRGAWKSEGKFRFLRNEPEDGFDCIEWLAGQTWSNGKIGMYGSSYLGSVQWLAARLKPPHLTCIAPQSPPAMFFYETPYVGGVFYKNHVLTWPRLVSKHSWAEMEFEWADWLLGIVQKDSTLHRAMAQGPNLEIMQKWHAKDADVVETMGELLSHPVFDDWWARIMLTPESAKDLELPIFAITGFHDADQMGCLYNWDLVEGNVSSSARRHLLIGPWTHVQMATGKIAPMGQVRFDQNADVSLPKLILRFFDTYMKGDSLTQRSLPKRCRLYTSGTNVWHEVSHYPPRESIDRPLYLSSGGHANSLFGDGRLSFDAPGKEPPDRLPADWELPVPTVGLGEDGRDVDTRHDVLVFTTSALDEDLTVLGPVRAVIHLAANAPDCDVVVRIADVRPDGTALNMTGEFGFGSFRARYREGFEREVLLTPGTPARLGFHICHMGHVFKKGHQVRISISATAAGVLDPNHHTGEPIATAVRRDKAIESIFHDTDRPSCIVLPLFKVNSQ